MAICIKEALKIIRENLEKVSFEMVPIENCGGRIVAQNIYAKHSLPNFNNSAMDGYGVKLENTNQEIEVIDEIFAGSFKQTQISTNQAIKIMTGARVPSSVEAIVPIELIEKINNKSIKLPKDIKKNQHIRFIGEDVKKDEIILKDGDELNFASVALLASQGISYIKVYRKPKVTVFTSGEELKNHWENIEDYQIYNSNTPSLLERVKELGCDLIFAGIANDNIKSIKDMIKNSLNADLIITTGGVSVGDADFTKEAFDELNMEILFNGLSIKPGKPTIFGKINNSYILNLPGNPLATALIFEIFGTITIQKLSGSKDIFHNYIETKIDSDFDNKKGKTTLIPGFFDGRVFSPAKKRLPGMVGVLNNCNSMMVLNKKLDYLQKDSNVKIIPINWKFFTNAYIDIFN